jgi:hypothetical protein
MIRRGFWVVTGAVLGVSGYRRVTRLASMLSGPKSAQSRPGPGSAAGSRMLPAPGRVLAQARPGRLAPGRVAPRRVAPGRVAPGGGVRTHVARAVAAAGFLRDVRDGMAEYWDLHRGAENPAATGRTLEARGLEAQALEARALEARALEARALETQTLEARGDRSSSGVPQQGRREP